MIAVNARLMWKQVCKHFSSIRTHDYTKIYIEFMEKYAEFVKYDGFVILKVTQFE